MGTKAVHPREVTGRTVLVWLLCFFGVVIAVNLVMARLAASTFRGVDTESAYKLGLAFNAELAAVRRQDNQNWKVTEHVERKGSVSVVGLAVSDAAGQPVSSLGLEVRLVHPADSRLDRDVVMKQMSPGVFRGETDAAQGQWDLVADLKRGDEYVFRSRSRITLR